MLSSIVRILRLCGALLAAALILQILMLPAGAGERAEFDAAVAQATAQYRVALKTLETRGREETAAEVARFRAAFQQVIDRFDANRSTFGDRDYAGLLMQLDARIVGAMIVIDFGSREAARDALAPIGETLSELDAAPAE
jgi:aminoglycoside/choline kinase family phosphotransferase